ncbi:Protein kinase-like domain [Pseudocohnilembus persalinus]|uniref:Protein kinase-like domain n=1 Tax=Pseudocohnilembus persalinus TaxID=266149 RepID=A0A0V0QU75_PSEPJ|nr:Protein kinase-like domain [Pseudocohnilembus persalinus]|eukprot:KRX05546.1 Protein kinase-like domain [Pseudocohnilembus persalinus]
MDQKNGDFNDIDCDSIKILPYQKKGILKNVNSNANFGEKEKQKDMNFPQFKIKKKCKIQLPSSKNLETEDESDYGDQQNKGKKAVENKNKNENITNQKCILTKVLQENWISKINNKFKNNYPSTDNINDQRKNSLVTVQRKSENQSLISSNSEDSEKIVQLYKNEFQLDKQQQLQKQQQYQQKNFQKNKRKRKSWIKIKEIRQGVNDMSNKISEIRHQFHENAKEKFNDLKNLYRQRLEEQLEKSQLQILGGVGIGLGKKTSFLSISQIELQNLGNQPLEIIQHDLQNGKKMVKQYINTVIGIIPPNIRIKKLFFGDSYLKLLEKYNQYQQFLNFKELGKGAFGVVVEHCDLITRVRYAKKIISDTAEFEMEKQTMKKLEKLFGKQQLQEFVALLVKTDEEEKSLFYEKGMCSLGDFSQARNDLHIYWFDRPQEVIYIGLQIYDYIMRLYSKGCFHSDLKLVNIIIIKDKILQKLYLKLIDMGCAQFQYQEIQGYTPFFFPPNQLTFSSKEQRLKAELYQLGRTLQELMYSSVKKIEEQNLGNLISVQKKQELRKNIRLNNKENIKKCLQKLRVYYCKDLCDFVEILLDLDSDIKDIEQKMNNLKQKCKQDYIDDQERIGEEIEHSKCLEFSQQAQRANEQVFQSLLIDAQNRQDSGSPLEKISAIEMGREEELCELLENNFDQAIQEVFKKKSFFNYCYILLEKVFRMNIQQQKEQIKEIYQKLIEYNSKNNHVFRAKIYSYMGQQFNDLTYLYKAEEIITGLLMNHLNNITYKEMKQAKKELAEIYLQFGTLFMKQNEIDKAEKYFLKEKESREEYQLNENNRKYANILYNLAEIQGIKKKYDQKLVLLRQYMEIYATNSYEIDENFVKGVGSIGATYFLIGNMDLQAEYLKEYLILMKLLHRNLKDENYKQRCRYMVKWYKKLVLQKYSEQHDQGEDFCSYYRNEEVIHYKIGQIVQQQWVSQGEQFFFYKLYNLANVYIEIANDLLSFLENQEEIRVQNLDKIKTIKNVQQGLDREDIYEISLASYKTALNENLFQNGHYQLKERVFLIKQICQIYKTNKKFEEGIDFLQREMMNISFDDKVIKQKFELELKYLIGEFQFYLGQNQQSFNQFQEIQNSIQQKFMDKNKSSKFQYKQDEILEDISEKNSEHQYLNNDNKNGIEEFYNSSLECVCKQDNESILDKNSSSFIQQDFSLYDNEYYNKLNQMISIILDEIKLRMKIVEDQEKQYKQQQIKLEKKQKLEIKQGSKEEQAEIKKLNKSIKRSNLQIRVNNQRLKSFNGGLERGREKGEAIQDTIIFGQISRNFVRKVKKQDSNKQKQIHSFKKQKLIEIEKKLSSSNQGSSSVKKNDNKKISRKVSNLQKLFQFFKGSDTNNNSKNKKLKKQRSRSMQKKEYNLNNLLKSGVSIQKNSSSKEKKKVLLKFNQSQVREWEKKVFESNLKENLFDNNDKVNNYTQNNGDDDNDNNNNVQNFQFRGRRRRKSLTALNSIQKQQDNIGISNGKIEQQKQSEQLIYTENKIDLQGDEQKNAVMGKSQIINDFQHNNSIQNNENWLNLNLDYYVLKAKNENYKTNLNINDINNLNNINNNIVNKNNNNISENQSCIYSKHINFGDSQYFSEYSEFGETEKNDFSSVQQIKYGYGDSDSDDQCLYSESSLTGELTNNSSSSGSEIYNSNQFSEKNQIISKSINNINSFNYSNNKYSDSDTQGDDTSINLVKNFKSDDNEENKSNNDLDGLEQDEYKIQIQQQQQETANSANITLQRQFKRKISLNLNQNVNQNFVGKMYEGQQFLGVNNENQLNNQSKFLNGSGYNSPLAYPVSVRNDENRSFLNLDNSNFEQNQQWQIDNFEINASRKTDKSLIDYANQITVTNKRKYYQLNHQEIIIQNSMNSFIDNDINYYENNNDNISKNNDNKEFNKENIKDRNSIDKHLEYQYEKYM